MAGIVDLNLKLQTWKMELSELESKAKKLQDKISFAQEILREDEEGLQIKTYEQLSVTESKQVSLAKTIEGLFTDSNMILTNANIFHHLDARSIKYLKPSIYATLSKLKTKGIIEAIEKGGKTAYRLKKKKEEEKAIPFSYVQN